MFDWLKNWPLNPILLFKGLRPLLIFFCLSFILSLLACLSKPVQTMIAMLLQLKEGVVQYAFLLLCIGLAVLIFQSLVRTRFFFQRQAFYAACYLQICILLAALLAQLAVLSLQTAADDRSESLTFVIVDLALSFGLSAGSRLGNVPPLAGPSYSAAKSATTDFVVALAVLREQLRNPPTNEIRNYLMLARDGIDRLINVLNDVATDEEAYYSRFIENQVLNQARIIQKFLAAPQLDEVPELLRTLWSDWGQPLPPQLDTRAFMATRSLLGLLEEYHAKR